MRGSAAGDGLFPLLFVGTLMDSNTNKQTEEGGAPQNAPKSEEVVTDLATSNNEQVTEQGQSPAQPTKTEDNIETAKSSVISTTKLDEVEEPIKVETPDETAKDENKLSSRDNVEGGENPAPTDNIESKNGESSSNIEDVKSESEKPQEDQKLKDRQRLSGAARKRFKWLLEKGHTHEEARRLALIPMTADRGLKRNFQDKFELENTNKKQKPNTNSKTSKWEQGYKVPSPSPKVNSIKFGILSKNYPEEILTSKQLKSIEATILERIVMQKEGEVKPKFVGTTFRVGFMVISCADKATGDWLQNAIGNIKPWPEASLVTVKENEIPRPQILHASFFNSADDSNDKILGFIGAQNDGLNIAQWRVVERKVENKTVHLVISADRKSAENLKKQDFKVNYKFGQVHIVPKESPKPTAKQTKPVQKDIKKDTRRKQDLNRDGRKAHSSRPSRKSRRPVSRDSPRADSWFLAREVGSTSRFNPSIFYNR